MVVIVMWDIKARKELRASSLIGSGGQVFMRMLIRQSRIADDVNSMGEGRKKLPWY